MVESRRDHPMGLLRKIQPYPIHHVSTHCSGTSVPVHPLLVHLVVLGQATQPRRLTRSDLVSAPLDRLAHRQPLVFGHLAQCLTRPAVSFNHGRIPFTDGDQHPHRQILPPLLALGTCPPPLGLHIQRRPTSLLSDRLLTHHVTLSSLRSVIPP